MDATIRENEKRYNSVIGATYREDSEMLKSILSEAKVFAHDDLARALRLAAEHGYEECARILLEHHAMPDVHDQNGYSSLIIACRQGNADIVQLLIDFKCNINKATFRVRATGLHWAASYGHLDCVKLLLKAGCKLEAKTMHGRTALMLCSRSDFEDCVDTLISEGADVNSKDNLKNTALHYACSEGSIECARLLIKAGADVNAKGSNDSTPLLLAARKGCTGLVKLLLRQSNLNISQCTQQMSVLHCAAESGSVECVQLLLEHGLDIDWETENGFYGHDIIVNKGLTPLMVASLNGHRDVVRLLAENGADINRSDAEGYSPITHAINKGQPQCVLELIRLGCVIDSVNPVDNYLCPLFVAIKKSRDCLKILLRSDVNLNVIGPDSHGILLTPLELALSVPNQNIVCKMLFAAGYKPSIITQQDNFQEYMARAAQEDEELFCMITESFTKCQSLFQLSRDKIRHQLGRRLVQNIDELPLPQALKDSVYLMELEEIY